MGSAIGCGYRHDLAAAMALLHPAGGHRPHLALRHHRISIGRRSELEHVLDARLQAAARMVHSLAMATGTEEAGTAPQAPAPLPPPFDTGYGRQLSCQIWSFDGCLIARSAGAPNDALTDESTGFSDRQTSGET